MASLATGKILVDGHEIYDQEISLFHAMRHTLQTLYNGVMLNEPGYQFGISNLSNTVFLRSYLEKDLGETMHFIFDNSGYNYSFEFVQGSGCKVWMTLRCAIDVQHHPLEKLLRADDVRMIDYPIGLLVRTNLKNNRWGFSDMVLDNSSKPQAVPMRELLRRVNNRYAELMQSKLDQIDTISRYLDSFPYGDLLKFSASVNGLFHPRRNDGQIGIPIEDVLSDDWREEFERVVKIYQERPMIRFNPGARP